MKKIVLFFILIFYTLFLYSHKSYTMYGKNGVDDLARCGVTEDECIPNRPFRHKTMFGSKYDYRCRRNFGTQE